MHWLRCRWLTNCLNDIFRYFNDLARLSSPTGFLIVPLRSRRHIQTPLSSPASQRLIPSLIRDTTLNSTRHPSFTALFLLDVQYILQLSTQIVSRSVLWLLLQIGIAILYLLLLGIRLVCAVRCPHIPLISVPGTFLFQSLVRFFRDSAFSLWFSITIYLMIVVSLILRDPPIILRTLPINSVDFLVSFSLQFLLVHLLNRFRIGSYSNQNSKANNSLQPPFQPVIFPLVSYIAIKNSESDSEEDQSEAELDEDIIYNSPEYFEKSVQDTDGEFNPEDLTESKSEDEEEYASAASGYDPKLTSFSEDFESELLHDPKWVPESNHDISLADLYLNPDAESYLLDFEAESSSPEYDVFTAYKRVDKKIKPINGHFPESAQVRRTIPVDPLLTLPRLDKKPPPFKPTSRLTQERMNMININPDGYLSEQEERLFMQVLTNNETSLAFDESDRGTLKESYFSPYIMPTIEHTPWQIKHRPIAPGIRQQVIQILKDKIAGGVYEPSQSSYRSSWFCVQKKTANSLRVVHDLQPLNEVSIRDAGVPPKLDDFVEPFAGAQCYSVFDLFCGFDARKLAPQSRDLTTFLTPLGPLRLTSMPMGYTNSPAEFQQSMIFIIQPEIPDVANIFIDDLPIKGPKTQYLDASGMPEVLPENPEIRRFIWEHAVDVNRVMHRIKESGATFSAKKIQMCRPEVIIIGQKCTPDGRLPENRKVDKILNWPILKTPKEARGFLGLCGGVRIWIKGYSQLARPISELWRKDEEFEWTERRQIAFDTLKQLVSSAPALRPIDYESDLPVILSVDSSYIAVGFILSQMDNEGRRRPARYGSIPMNEREARYSQPKLELYGLFRALRSYRIYLVGVKNLVIEVDAKYIKGMLNEPDLQPNAAINRWIQGILLFDFKLVHVPADKHVGPDALSRRELGEGEVVEEEDDSWLDDIALHTRITNSPEIETAVLYSETPDAETLLKQIFRFLTTLQAPYHPDPQSQKRFIRKTLKYFVDDERYMWKKSREGPMKVIMNQDRRLGILTRAHEDLGHRGAKSVFETLRTRFYWPYMWASIKHHVASCHECQIRNTRTAEIPLTVSTPTTLFSKVYIDVMRMPKVREYQYIVAARDDLSRASEGKALKRNNSQELANFFWEYIYCRYGAVQHVITDNGPEMKRALAHLLKRMKIPQIRLSAYNSKGNGVVERGHFTIREAIVKACKGDIEQWPSKVPLAFFADRVAISGVTGFSAYYLLYGTHPVLPFDLVESTFLISGFKSGLSSTEYLALRIRQLAKHPDDLAKAAKRLREARFKSKAQFEKKFSRRMRNLTYKEGALVLVRNKANEVVLGGKHQPRYLGPYEVLRRTKGGSYVLRQLDGPVLRQGVGAFRLYPYLARDAQGLKHLAGASDIDSDPESDSPVTDSD